MSSVNRSWRRAKLALAVSLASTSAWGVSFNVGPVEGQIDSELSIGASWSTAKADRNLIGANNGGKGQSEISDDGRLNFKRGETFSKLFTGMHALELKYGDSGLYVRGKYWYDFELQDDSRPFKPVSDSGRKASAQSAGAQLLDAFVYHNYEIADQPGAARLGKQVVSWGEGVFIGGGINAINPTDVSAYRRPGTEYKDGLVPVNLFYISQNLTDNLSAEAFYQLDWEQSQADNCGTFFSQSDVMADGCSGNYRVMSKRSALDVADLAALTGAGVDVNGEGVLVRRGADRNARNGGQFGVAMHYVFEPLDTEFGAYFMNYHSRDPILSAGAAPQSAYNAAAGAGGLGSMIVAGNSSYYVEYPEDIHLYGLSFATRLSTGTAWKGELSYRPNAPVQLNSNDLLYANITLLPGLASASPLTVTPGADVQGYRRKEITQFQTSLSHVFDNAMGANRLTVTGEVGVTYVGGLDSSSDLRYGRDPVFGSDGHDGFTTATSWGYRGRAVWEYNSVLPGVNLKPNLGWSHDISGYSPGPNANFEEGRKAISVGLDGEYQNTYTSSLSYTNFFGGRYNTLSDRDFVALTVGVKF
ncbi:DUF1302 domain-containing protein [Pseudomonas psychrophila]|uniref:DUF1302 domain-containing protein n=1 Tax=Pseudomonas psychrophila TaxID=122355 RepID=A0ABY0VLT3_9PSED|nr:DUF1302 domain-containing protein [Pseudomonas psychrophila]KAB0493095.1 DUF1302 domain-containing protein [Pseudomonas psychrophila]KMN03031.1 type V secretory pathway, adhesin AidA [Pseudomonas psychrophila]QIE31991.1 DUF1302 domain-containing protein [Pseudomonas psychrophila]WVI98543.1 DUF1302 domain-containing protein [Pseudomonas psychrophila]SDU40439.1 Protein of unknown function [Pseudomonas psychrophila]